MNFFGERYDCQPDVCHMASVAHLRLWVMRNSQGWQCATRYAATALYKPLSPVAANAEKLPWQRVIAPDTSTQVLLVPALPDRSVMSKPEERIEVAPGSLGTFYVTIPLWLCVRTEGAPEMKIYEQPTQILSKTWFGHPAEEGEIGYALTTRARQNLAELTDVAGRVICPLLIKNKTETPLVFSQLLLRVRHMSVYRAEDGKLWTNECRLEHTDSIFPAALSFGRTAPRQAGNARLLSQPREAPPSVLKARVFMNTLFKHPF